MCGRACVKTSVWSGRFVCLRVRLYVYGCVYMCVYVCVRVHMRVEGIHAIANSNLYLGRHRSVGYPVLSKHKALVLGGCVACNYSEK